jgi:hypothetical protein
LNDAVVTWIRLPGDRKLLVTLEDAGINGMTWLIARSFISGSVRQHASIPVKAEV